MWFACSLLIASAFFGQEFAVADLPIVGLLVILEGVLSIDNALVLGLLARRLPKDQQKRALTYGLVGAFVFRVVAVGMASYLMRWRVVKLLGGGYLVYIAVKHLFFESKEDGDDQVVVGPEGQPDIVHPDSTELTPEERELEIRQRTPFVLEDRNGDPENPYQAGATAAAAPTSPSTRKHAKFWPTVVVIELTDIAFAVDSILAAIAMVSTSAKPAVDGGFHPKLWVVITGGLLGLVLMRFAAVVFIKLLEKFPRFEDAAYFLVTIIGAKLLADWAFNPVPTEDNLHPTPVLDFHDWRHWAFWTFWLLMVAAFSVGFIPRGKKSRVAAAGGTLPH